MGNIGDPITTAVPTVGTAGPDYATSIDAILTETVARLTTKVTPSSMLFNTTLDLGGEALTQASYVTMVNTTVTPAASPSCRLVVYSGDLWYVSPSGTIKLTTGSALNAAGVGGITGDYGGANPAQFRYDSANARYDAYANYATSTLSGVCAAKFQLAASPTSFRVTMEPSGAMAANYTLTLPPQPASSAQARPLYVDSSGKVTAGIPSTSKVTLVYSSMRSVVSNIGERIRSVDGRMGVYKQFNAPAFAAKEINGLPEGFVITSIVVSHYSSGPTGGSTFSFVRDDHHGAASSVASVYTSGTAGYLTSTITCPGTALDSAYSYYVEWVPDNVADTVGHEWYGFKVIGYLAP